LWKEIKAFDSNTTFNIFIYSYHFLHWWDFVKGGTISPSYTCTPLRTGESGILNEHLLSHSLAVDSFLKNYEIYELYEIKVCLQKNLF